MRWQADGRSLGCVRDVLLQSRLHSSRMLALAVLEDAVRYRWAVLSADERLGIRLYVTQLCVQLSGMPPLALCEQEGLPPPSLHSSTPPPPASTLLPSTVLWKAGEYGVLLRRVDVVLVHVVRWEWPERWPTFLDDLLSSSTSSPTQLHNALYILRVLSEEVFDYSHTSTVSGACGGGEADARPAPPPHLLAHHTAAPLLPRTAEAEATTAGRAPHPPPLPPLDTRRLHLRDGASTSTHPTPSPLQQPPCRSPSTPLPPGGRHHPLVSRAGGSVRPAPRTGHAPGHGARIPCAAPHHALAAAAVLLVLLVLLHPTLHPAPHLPAGRRGRAELRPPSSRAAHSFHTTPRAHTGEGRADGAAGWWWWWWWWWYYSGFGWTEQGRWWYQ